MRRPFSPRPLQHRFAPLALPSLDAAASVACCQCCCCCCCCCLRLSRVVGGVARIAWWFTQGTRRQCIHTHRTHTGHHINYTCKCCLGLSSPPTPFPPPTSPHPSYRPHPAPYDGCQTQWNLHYFSTTSLGVLVLLLLLFLRLFLLLATPSPPPPPLPAPLHAFWLMSFCYFGPVSFAYAAAWGVICDQLKLEIISATRGAQAGRLSSSI